MPIDTFHLLDNPAFRRWFGRSQLVDDRGAPKLVYHSTSSPDFDRFRRRLGDVGVHVGTLGQAQDRLDYLTSRADLDPLGRNPRLHGGHRILPLVMRAENPLRLPDVGSWNAENLIDELGGALKIDIRHPPYDRLWFMKHPSTQLSNFRDLIKSKGYDSIVYRNTGEVEGAHPLQQAQDAAREVLMDRQRRLKRPLNAFDQDDVASPEYQAFERAYQAQHEYRQNNAQDSYIALEPTQVKSIFNQTWGQRDPRLNYRRGGLALARDLFHA